MTLGPAGETSGFRDRDNPIPLSEELAADGFSVTVLFPPNRFSFLFLLVPLIFGWIFDYDSIPAGTIRGTARMASWRCPSALVTSTSPGCPGPSS